MQGIVGYFVSRLVYKQLLAIRSASQVTKGEKQAEVISQRTEDGELQVLWLVKDHQRLNILVVNSIEDRHATRACGWGKSRYQICVSRLCIEVKLDLNVETKIEAEQ